MVKAGRGFYNLDCITKIDYTFEGDESRLIVHIYSDLSDKPLQLNGEQAALFLDNISHLEGCWAFSYPDEDVMKTKTILKKESSMGVKEEIDSTEEPYSPEEKIPDENN